MIDWWSYFACQCFLSSSYFSQAFFVDIFSSNEISKALRSHLLWVRWIMHDSFTAYDLIGQIIRHYIRVWIYPQKCCLIYGHNYSFKYPLLMLNMCIINLVEEQKRGNVLFLFFYTTRGFQNIINIYTKKWSSYSLYHTWYQKVIYCTLPFC